ncbi:MAG: L-threonylcarbamoyladenylate synthase, partial [Candidatus Micrarchaeota archaeon]|nr:L-threonylcarbamoyladenylate synthase [Candidatus Micrarchaeota archaeon]
MALSIPLSDYDTALEAVCAAILAGGIVIYPTDTLYGIGCDATNPLAVEKIRKLKKRDGEKPFSIIVSDFEMLKEHCKISNAQSHALQALLPGPYTFILPLKKPLPVSNSKSIGVRVPGHIFMRAVSK